MVTSRLRPRRILSTNKFLLAIAGANAEKRSAMRLYHVDGVDPEAVCNDGSPGARCSHLPGICTEKHCKHPSSTLALHVPITAAPSKHPRSCKLAPF